ncbi:MAG: hypothetical protein M3367_18685 [Acidobacteriota bacterium]|nr:hypothetical protein [Acidobacteriota bacterium]
MKKYLITAGTILIATLGFNGQVRAQETKPSPSPAATQNKPQFEEWSDDFTSDKLDEKKWEKFTFEGGSGGKLEVKDGEVKIRSAGKTRAGIRTKDSFSGDRFAVEGRLSKVGAAYPEPGSRISTLGFGTLTVLFDGSGRNRIEWMLTSEGTFEAWSVVDGRSERLDNKKLATKMKNPVLLIVRKGDEFSFYINDPKGAPQDAQLGLTATVKNLPKSFHVMLYGYGSSENNWDGVRVVVPK